MPASPVLADALAPTTTPGMAAIVIRDLRAEPELVAGVRVINTTDRVRPGDRWHLGSDGKAMTATLIARLVEAGALAWDTPLSRMLPDLADGMQPQYRDVTLPDLLSHRAGLPENIVDEQVFTRFYTDTAPPRAQRLRYITACLKDPPIGPARAASHYSNTGPIIAGVIAERVANQSFEELIAAQVFAPLGMSSVTFVQAGGPGEPHGHVDGRDANRPQDINPPIIVPAGGMRMSMRDWSRFCIDHLAGARGAGRLLKPDTYRFLHAPQWVSDTGTGWALGWGVNPHPMNLRGPALTHSGSDGNWMALVCLFPDTGNGVIVAANAAESMKGDDATKSALKALAPTVAEPLPAQSAH
jgi:CubicO group peptidase (beta-lactamase class C family)